MQAVISASTAALLRPNRIGGFGNSSSGAAQTSAAARLPLAHIPTPDATGLVVNYSDYYKHDVFVDPYAHIRYSDTVEETMGIAYTMDEEDADWLEDHNAALLQEKASVIQDGSASGEDNRVANADNGTSVIARNGHYPPLQPIHGYRSAPQSAAKPNPSKDVKTARAATKLSEDDFELVMDLFERITDRRAPTLHLV